MSMNFYEFLCNKILPIKKRKIVKFISLHVLPEFTMLHICEVSLQNGRYVAEIENA